MSGIPLPALAVRPPEQPDMMGNMSKLMALKSMMGGQQLQQQQLQNAQLTNQQTQMDLDSQRALQKAYKEAQGDPDKTEQLAAKYGAKPTALLEWQKAVTTQKIQAVDLVSKQGAEAKRQADLLQGAHEQIAALPEEQRAAAWPQALQQLSAQGVDISKSPAQYPGANAFQMMGYGIKSHSQMVEDALKQAEAGKNAAQAGEANAATSLKQQESAYYQAHGGAPGVPVEMQQMSDWLRKNPGKSPSDFVVWKAKNSPSVIMQGGPGGPTGDPGVDMVGQGRMDYATATARYSPEARKGFNKELGAKYPNYQQSTYGIEKKVGEEFTSGDAAKNLTTFNTAIEHAKQLDAATADLKNIDERTLNKLGNAYGVEMGKDPVTNFGVIKNALVGEISKVFKGGQATDAEISAIKGPFDAANSPEQLKGAIKQAISLMNSKRDALKQQYEAGRQGKPNFGEGQQHTPGGQASGLKEGQTGTGSDGKKYIVKGGVWVNQ